MIALRLLKISMFESLNILKMYRIKKKTKYIEVLSDAKLGINIKGIIVLIAMIK